MLNGLNGEVRRWGGSPPPHLPKFDLYLPISPTPHLPKLENFNESSHLQNRVGAGKTAIGRKKRLPGELLASRSLTARKRNFWLGRKASSLHLWDFCIAKVPQLRTKCRTFASLPHYICTPKVPLLPSVRRWGGVLMVHSWGKSHPKSGTRISRMTENSYKK